MAGDSRVQELLTLKTIAETLNRSNDLEPMLEDAVRQFLHVTGLTTGWVFLVGEQPTFACVADCGVPPALSWGDRTPLRQGNCWCVGDFWSGDLKRAVDVMSCKRLDDAVKYKWGDTEGIEHHATVPLMAGGELFGILNVAAPGKRHFSDEELALLEAVSYQIGTAVERVRLYQAEQRRARSLALLGEVSRRFGAVLEADRLPTEVVRQVGAAFDWPVVALFLRDGPDLSLRAVSESGLVQARWRRFPPAGGGAVGTAFRERRAVVVADAEREPKERPRRGFPAYRSAVAVPVKLRDEALGVLMAGSDKPRAFAQESTEIIGALADHVALALENARLYEQRREIVRLEERNRLARDLHDSVSQTLFSLALTAKGAEGAVGDGKPDLALSALKEIQELAGHARTEMRSLIWQLRPAGLEEGLGVALKRYGDSLGLEVAAEAEGLRSLPRTVEEALWRIGQEALNNVSKHAGVARAEVRVVQSSTGVSMTVSDRGKGFSPRRPGAVARTLGLTTMRERAEALGGTFTVESQAGSGTLVRVWIPCPEQ